jgi:CRISPR-associated endonuclease/helicase Cas3
MDAPEGDTRRDLMWAAEHPKRYFASLVSVGTIDQALLAGLRVKHAHMRGAALARHLLVVDEVHASDAYMRRVLTRLLRDHLAAGGHAMLLSATLGAEARHTLMVEAAGGRTIDEPAPALAAAVAVPYPLLSTSTVVARAIALPRRGDEKHVANELRELLDDAAGVAAVALAAARAGAKVLVVRNTVDGAVAVQLELERLTCEDDAVLFRAAGVRTLHHGRFAREDRRLLDAVVERAVGGDRVAGGLIVVGTQTLEQSLDIDADFLITDLCPVDVLLQRLGRLHRHARVASGERPERYSEARAIVLVPAGGLEPFLVSPRPSGLRRHGLGYRIQKDVPQGVYADLTVLEATRRLIEERPRWSIPTMNRALVEGALHGEAVEALIASMPEETRGQWREHRNRIEGKALADSQVAQDGMLLRHRGLMDASNPRFDQRLVTRLDANDRLVDLPPGTRGPLKQTVSRIKVPGWMLPEFTSETPIDVSTGPEPGILALRLGDVQLVYDRHGLRRAEGSA